MQDVPFDIVREAKILSTKSEMKHRMGAVIFRRKKIISKGKNRYISRMKMSVKKMILGIPYYSIHAEIDAIMKCRSMHDIVGCDIYVHRLNGNKAEPCEDCMSILIYLGIRKIFFSNGSD